MKERRMDVVWGLVLIVLGALFMGQSLGWLPQLGVLVWSGLFAVTSVMFFGTYLSRGREEWGWLFPAFATGAVALVIFLAETGFDGAFLGSLVLWAVSAPFWLLYVRNRQENWWALIPGWVTAVIGGVVLLADVVPGEWIGALIMFAIGLPFIVVYLSNREHWWALIPASVLTVMGFVILLSTVAGGNVMGFIVLGAIALPFSIIYLRQPAQWWALIPAGVLGSIAIVALLSGLQSGDGEFYSRMLGAVMFLGWAATFGVLWLGRKRHGTDWAKYPAGGLAVLAVLVLVLGSAMNNLWALVLIGAGIWLLIDNYRGPSLKKG